MGMRRRKATGTHPVCGGRDERESNGSEGSKPDGLRRAVVPRLPPRQAVPRRAARPLPLGRCGHRPGRRAPHRGAERWQAQHPRHPLRRPEHPRRADERGTGRETRLANAGDAALLRSDHRRRRAGGDHRRDLRRARGDLDARRRTLQPRRAGGDHRAAGQLPRLPRGRHRRGVPHPPRRARASGSASKCSRRRK